MIERRRRPAWAAEHSSDLSRSLVRTEGSHRRLRAVSQASFLYQEVLIAKAGDLGQMRHAQHLVSFGHRQEFPPHPDLHEAMTVMPSADTAENTVLEVLQKGFRLHDRLLRPARVVVSRKP